jgi:uncharacterized membrane protein YoaK (UPF0700 family)
MSLPKTMRDSKQSSTVSTQTQGTDGLPVALLALTFVTGLVDAVSFLGLGHVFTANMTGNVVFLAFAVAGAPGLSIPRSLVSLVAFLIGAAAGGRLGVTMADSRRRAWLVTSTLIEGTLLLAAALALLRFDAHTASPISSLYAGIILTALAMGLRNATVRRQGVPDLTTTVLTLTLTGVAADSSLAGGKNPRVGRRLGSVLAMFGGAVAGTLLLKYGMTAPLLFGAVCTFAVAGVCAVLAPPPPAT